MQGDENEWIILIARGKNQAEERVGISWGGWYQGLRSGMVVQENPQKSDSVGLLGPINHTWIIFVTASPWD